MPSITSKLERFALLEDIATSFARVCGVLAVNIFTWTFHL
jgi:hypothetical protein